MEEEYRKSFSKSSERNNNSEEIDPLSLFVRNIPHDMSQDEFTFIVTDDGKRAIRNCRLISKPQSRYSYGFVNFETEKEALNALNELNQKPPFSVIFANKSKKRVEENEYKDHSNRGNLSSFGGRGKGMYTSSNGPKSNMNSPKENIGFSSRGRGQRISLDGPISTIKVVAGDDGRKVTVDTPPKKTEPECNGQFSDDGKDLDLPKVPNPFYFCFNCGHEGMYSCKHCRKPYCSKTCQNQDYPKHKELCWRAKEVSETLLRLYKNFPVQGSDSGVSDNGNSESEKLDSAVQIKSEIPPKTQVSVTSLKPGEVEMVSIIHIESASKFWIHLQKFSQKLSTIERQLTCLQKDLKKFHNQFCVSPQLNCCTMFKGKMCRAKVLKVKSQNEILVALLDYGKALTVQKCALCDLPVEFRELPAQAIPCRLVSDDNEVIQWNEEATLSFELHASNKTYKAHVFNCSSGLHDVCLINDDGIPLHSILAEEKKAIQNEITSPPSQTDGKPPSVWSKLKPRVKVNLIPSIIDEASIWCYLTTGGSDLNEIMDIEKLLKNYSGEDITRTAEEDEFAVGFSNEYKQYYRCRILKRKRESFLVHYIDYGNQEEVTRLSCLSEELLQKCCYLVRCERPSDLSIADFQKFMGDSGAEVTVVNLDKNSATLSFHCKKQNSVVCYPYYANSVIENDTSDIQASPVLSSLTSKPKETPQSVDGSKVVAQTFTSPEVLSSSSNITLVSKPRKTLQTVKDHKILSEKIIVPKVLLSSKNYIVKVVFYKTYSDLYVLLKEDETEMNKMINNLNSFCNSENNSYIPNIGEIVSCKFNDGLWYRGEVLEKLDNQYRIFFVDYGNEYIAANKEIQVLSERFDLPQFSICVSLSGIKKEIPERLLAKLFIGEWDMKVINPNRNPIEVMLFQKDIPITEMIEDKSNKTKSNLKFQKLPVKSTVKICFEDEKYLYVNQVKDLKSLNEMSTKLNNSNLPTPKCPKIHNVYSGLFVDGSFYRISIEEAVSSDSYKVYFLDFGNYETVSASDLRELSNDLFSLPVYSIPLRVQNRKELTLNMEDEYTVEVIDMQSDVQTVKFLNLDKFSNSTTVKEATVNETEIDVKDKSFLTFKKLPEKGIVEIKVCYVDQKFVYLHQVSDLPIVDDLLIKLNSLSKLPPVVKPIINKVYCGLYSDGIWYRVSIEEATSSNAYKVYFLDFGNYESLLVDNLRELPSDLFSIPVCCISVIADKKKGSMLEIEKQYKIQVTGEQDNLQKVGIVDQNSNSLKSADKNQNDVENTKNTNKADNTEKLPHISSLKKQRLQDGLNEVKFFYSDGNVIYCQMSSDCDCVMDMSKALRKYGREGKAPVSVSIGDIVCAQSSDNSWNRACILSDKKAPKYKVLFFDYGNTEDVTLDCIKILPKDFLNYPIYAIPMKIENADSITDTAIFTKSMLVKKIKEDGDTYVVEIQLEVSCPKISTLKRLTLPEDLISNVTICHADDDLYYVQLTSNADNVEKLINQLSQADMFCNVPCPPEEGDIICAKYIDGLWYRCSITKVLSDKIEIFLIDYGNSHSVTIDSVKVIPLELCSYAIAGIPIKFKDEEMAQSKIMKNIFTFDVKVGKVVDNIQVVDIISQADSSIKPRNECDTQVYTPVFLSSFTKSFLQSSCKVIFKANTRDLYIAVKSDDCIEIEKLNSALQESKTDFISHLPSVNEVLLAKKDNFWQRCSVLDVLAEKNVYRVFFVDLGITEDIQKCDMRNLPDICRTYPLFGIKISIESEQPVILDKSYNIYVLKQNADDIYHVRVYHQYKYSLIRRKELMPKKETDVIFCHKEGEKLFLQDISDAETLEEVQKKLADCSSGSCLPYKPDVGELVCAISQLDNSWYRGCIEEVLSSDEYKVFFIDYGNYENVQKKHLQPMPFNLTQFPSLCIPVKFVNNEITEKIELFKLYKILAESKASNNVQIVRLIDNNQVVASSELKPSAENLEKSDATKKFLLMSSKYVQFNSGEQDIVIYSVDEEGLIYCAPYDTDNIQANLALSKLITEYCEAKGIPFENCEPEAGEMVLALYQADKSWYRAVVIEKSHPQYDVYFVDYGNTENVGIASLRKMEEKFMELDIQAHMCSLVGFDIPEGNLQKVCNELKNFDVFSYPEPLKANVKIVDGEIALNVPKITSQLLEKKLVTAVIKN